MTIETIDESGIESSPTAQFIAKQKSPARLNKAIAGIQAARVDRAERRAAREHEERPHRAPRTRFTDKEIREELLSYRDWDDRPKSRITGGMLLSGYVK